MKRNILNFLFMMTFFCLCVPSIANAINIDRYQLEAELANRDWLSAEQTLKEMAKVNKPPYNIAEQHIILTWIYVNQNDLENARQHIVKVEELLKENEKKQIISSFVETMLHHAKLALQFPNINDYEHKDELIFVGGDSIGTQITENVDKYNFLSFVNEKIQRFVNDDLNAIKKPSLFAYPTPKKLEKGEFEKTSDFLTRVKNEEEKYRSRVMFLKKQISEKEMLYHSAMKSRLNAKALLANVYTEFVMNRVLNKVDLVSLNYDADKELFYSHFQANAQYENKNKTVLDYNLIIPFPIKEGPKFKEGINQHKPVLVFQRTGKELKLVSIFVVPKEGKPVLASVVDKENKNSRIVKYEIPEIKFQLGNIETQSTITLVDSVSTLSIDPEINKLKEKINQVLADKQRQRELERLKDELKELEDAQLANYEDDLIALLDMYPTTPVKLNTFAIVIGIEQYKKAHPVLYAKRSADMFSKVLEKVISIPQENLRLITESDATSGNIRAQIRDIVSFMKEDSTLFFFYAGHGIPVQKENGQPFLLPYDMEPAFVEHDEYYRVSNILQELDKNKSGNVVAIFDSCFSGNTDNKLLFKGVAPGLMRVKDPILNSNRVTLITAGDSRQFSNYYPKRGHRLMSYFLMKGMLEGLSDLNALYHYVESNVQLISKRMGPSYKQTPQLKGKHSGALF